MLGHVIAAEGVSTDPVKIQAVQNWPAPTNVIELRSFCSIPVYRHYADLASSTSLHIISILRCPLQSFTQRTRWKRARHVAGWSVSQHKIAK